MAGITSGIGLVTGINIEDTVNKLIAVQAQPRDNLTARKKDIEARQTAVADLTALTLGVQFAARRLKAADLFTQKSVTSSNTSALTATASSTAVPGQYQFVPVRLATTQHLLAGGVSTKDQPLGAGTFSFRFGGFANESINLDEINGGDGLARGKIKITDRSGASATIDLRYAVTVDDVLAAINQNESVEVQASVAGDRLVLTDNSGGSGNLRVDEVNSGTTAASLGLSGINAASSTATGQDILRLYSGLDLNRLNDGTGVKFNAALSDLQVTFRDGSSPLDIDFQRVAKAAVKASITTTAAAGTNGQVKLTAVNGGADLNGVTVQFTNSGALTNGGATVAYDADNKTITFDIDPAHTTANDLVAAAAADSTFSQSFTVALPTGGNGTGLISLTDTGVLAGGVDAVTAGNERTLGDVLQTLNAIDPTRLKAELSGDGDRIVLTDLTTDQGGTFAVTDLNGGNLAESLGLGGAAAGGTLSGERLMGGLKTTLLKSLNGGQGVGTLGDLTLTDRSGAQATVSLAGAATLDDVIATINGAGLGIRAEYNSSRNGLQLVDTTGGTGPLVVADADATTTATKLGLAGSVNDTKVNSGSLHRQVVSEQTTLDSYMGGKGVAKGSLEIIDSMGRSSAINLNSLGAKTVGDVIDAINALSIGVEARINDNGDGIALIDTAGGTSKLTVKDVGSGTTAADLRLKGVSTTQTINGQPTEVIDGSTTLTVNLDGTQSLEDLVEKINGFGLGAQASIVTETAGTVKYRLALQSLVDGKKGELLVDGSSLGIGFQEVTAAQDGLLQFGGNEFGVAGTLLASANNVYKDAAVGIDVTVLAASTQPITVTVGETSKSLSSSMQLFVDQYNKLRDKFATYTAYNTDTNAKGPLFGSSEALRIDNDMGRILTNPIRGLGDVQSLAELGVSIDDKGKLTFDSSKLDARFADDPEGVTKFFSDETRGFAVRADEAIEQLVGVNHSVLLSRAETLQRQVEDYAKRIDTMNERLDRSRETLLKQFYNMELVIGRIKNNLDAIGSIQYIPPVQRSSG